MRIFGTFTFEAAHWLPRVPAGHKCGRVHGHNWTVEIHCEGEPDERTGWIVDFYEVQRAWTERVYDVVDHRPLNEIAGLENPTTENLAIWIWNALKPSLPSLECVTIRETPQFGCIYWGPTE